MSRVHCYLLFFYRKFEIWVVLKGVQKGGPESGGPRFLYISVSDDPVPLKPRLLAFPGSLTTFHAHHTLLMSNHKSAVRKRSRLVVSAVKTRLSSPGSSPGWVTALCSRTRYFTPIMRLFTRAYKYKWIPANLMRWWGRVGNHAMH